MSVTKPARWAVSPAAVDPKWQWAWRGLIALVPCWDPTVFDVVQHNLATDSTRPKLQRKTTPIGLGLRASQSLDDGASFVAGAYDKFFTTTGPITLMVTTTRYGSHDDTDPHIWGYYLNAADKLAINTWSDELMEIEAPGNQWAALSVVFPTEPTVCFGFTESGRQRLYMFDLNGDIVDSSTATLTYSAATAGGRLVLGAASAFGVSNDFHIAAAWDRELTEDEMRLIAKDPFGPIRPAQGFSRDATWQDLNPTLRAIPGAADGP